jgi:Tol biopolymer transport system component
MTITSGTRLGPYEVVAPLGAGGMGEVWRGRDTRLERSVAIKVLPAEFAENAQLKLRFEREAKTISQLNHPHICTLYDVGDGYLVMELLDGESLADRLAKGPLPLREVLKYGVHIAEALGKAHREGVIHRDLKPGNIMITKGGAKLLDFGLAKSALVAVPDGATVQKPLTQEGFILGTFQYMAPEQLAGEEPDARTDIFALGAMLYEMATGKRAFEGKSRTSLIGAIVSGEPRPMSEIQPLTPPALEHVVRKCLAKDPDDRWQSASDIAEELRWIGEVGSQAGVAAPLTLRRKTRERLAWSVAAIALVAAIAAGVYALRATRVHPRSYSFIIPSRTADYDLAYGAEISPDGRNVVFAARNPERKRLLWLRHLDGLEAHPLPATEGVVGIGLGAPYFWTADSQHVVVVSNGKLLKVPIDGGPPQVLLETPGIAGGSANADGEIILGANEAGIQRLDRGGKLTPITHLDAKNFEVSHFFPSFLPDGKRFLFHAITRDPARSEQVNRLYVGTLDGKTKYVGPTPSRTVYVQPGYLFFVRDGTLMAVRFDLKKLEMVGDPITLTDNVWFFKPTGGADFSVSNDGVLVCHGAAAASRLYWVGSDGRVMTPAGEGGNLNGVALSPSGDSAAVAVSDLKIGTPDLWIWGLSRPTRRRLTFDSGYEGNPVWSPDGSRIYYASDRKGIPDIYEKVIDGSSEDRVIVGAPNVQFPRSVSPDGKFLLYQSSEDPKGQGDLMVIPLDGDRKPQAFVKTPFTEGGSARFSPDGRWVGYSSAESGKLQVYVKPFPGPGTARQISLDGGESVRWSNGGKTILFQNGRKIMKVSFEGGKGTATDPLLVTEMGYDIGSYEVAADGRLLMQLATETESSAPNRVIVNWTRLLKQ